MGKRIYLCLAKMSESGAEQRFVQVLAVGK